MKVKLEKFIIVERKKNADTKDVNKYLLRDLLPWSLFEEN